MPDATRESDKSDFVLTPHDLLIRYGLDGNISPLVDLVHNNGVGDAMVVACLEFAMVVGLRRGLMSHLPSISDNRFQYTKGLGE